MPDLVIHLAVSRLSTLPFRSAPVRLGALIGAALPDIGYKGFHLLTSSAEWYCMPTHAPLVYLLMAYAVSLLFDARDRKALFAGMCLGGWLHIAVDFGKHNVVPRTTLLEFPFSMRLYEGGWYLPETSVYATLPALLLFLALGWVERRWHGKDLPAA